MADLKATQGGNAWQDVRVSLGPDAEVTGKLSFVTPTRIEARGLEHARERMPNAGTPKCIEGRSAAGPAMLVLGFVDSATITEGELLLPRTVEQLNLVTAHYVDPGVAALREHEIRGEIDVAEFDLADEFVRVLDTGVLAGNFGMSVKNRQGAVASPGE